MPVLVRAWRLAVSAPPQLPKFNRSVSLVSWAFNEEELVEVFLRRANALMAEAVEDYEIILIDDGSVDRTPEIAARVAAELPRVRVLTNEVNMNIGPSSRRAIMAASKEFLFWQTTDWSYDLSQLRVYLELLRSYDIVAGTRTNSSLLWNQLRGISERSDNAQKGIVSFGNWLIIRTLFGVRMSDFQNVVLYPTQLLQSLEWESRSSFANPEYLCKAFWSGSSIVEVPINFMPRLAGTGEGTRPRAILHSLKDIARLFLRWRVLRRVDRRPGGRIQPVDAREWEDVRIAITRATQRARISKEIPRPARVS